MVSGSRRIPLVNHLPGCSGARRLAFGSILNQFMKVDAGCGKFPRTLAGRNCRCNKARTGRALSLRVGVGRGRLNWSLIRQRKYMVFRCEEWDTHRDTSPA